MNSYRTIHSRHRHCAWDRELEPVVRIGPGTGVEFEVVDASNGVIDPSATAGRLADIDPDRVNPVTGPVFVEGAAPGDTLIVTIEGFETSGWGWTAIIPGFGLLADQFSGPFLHLSTYDDDRVEFTPEIRLPARPFPGTIGVAPAAPGPHPMIPPHAHGGNIDVRHLTRGSRIHLPVAVEGGLFSVGDTHAAQGDGEVCGTAIESPMKVRLGFELEKGRCSRFPRIDCPDPDPGGGEVIITTGIAADAVEAARFAVSEMIDCLDREYQLAPELAYCLVSVAGDVRLAEGVNMPNWVVTVHLPRRIFL